MRWRFCPLLMLSRFGMHVYQSEDGARCVVTQLSANALCNCQERKKESIPSVVAAERIARSPPSASNMGWIWQGAGQHFALTTQKVHGRSSLREAPLVVGCLVMQRRLVAWQPMVFRLRVVSH